MAEATISHNHTPGSVCSICGRAAPIKQVKKEIIEKVDNAKKDPVLKGAHLPIIETTQVTFGGNNENVIEVMRQKYDYDCGQTNLAMLGYKDHGIRGREVSSTDISDLLGTSWEERPKPGQLPKNYATPHMVAFPTGERKTLSGKGQHNHWVIRVNDIVIDPARGVIKATDFDRDNEGKEMLAIPVPFRSPLKTAA